RRTSSASAGTPNSKSMRRSTSLGTARSPRLKRRSPTSTSPTDREREEPKMAVATRTLTFRDAIREAMRVEMERDPTVIVMGEDVAGGATVPGFENEDAWGGVLGVNKGLVQLFGRDRILDSPVSE